MIRAPSRGAILAFAWMCVGQADPRPRPGNPEPKYPETARRRLVTGDATFRARVSTEGRVVEVLVLRVPAPGLGFEDTVREAALAWRFEPLIAPAYYLGFYSFSLRPDDESEIRGLVATPRFHETATVIVGDDVYRKTGGSWPAPEDVRSSSGEIRSIDFSAGDAAEVRLETGAILRVLAVADVWWIVSWEDDAVAIEPPQKIEDVLPVFPLDARDAHRDQVVVLQALIDDAGVVRYLDVVTSVPELDEPAKAAALQWRFRPARRKGVAVPFVMTLTVGFAGEAP